MYPTDVVIEAPIIPKRGIIIRLDTRLKIATVNIILVTKMGLPIPVNKEKFTFAMEKNKTPIKSILRAEFADIYSLPNNRSMSKSE